MSRWMVVLGVALSATSGAAQDAAQLRARAERLAALVEASEARRRAAVGRDAEQFVPRVIVASGELRALAPAPLLDTARRALSAVVAGMEPRVRRNLEIALTDFLWVIHRAGDTLPADLSARHGGRFAEYVGIDPRTGSERLADQLRGKLEVHLAQRADSGANNWLSGRFPVRPLSREAHTFAYMAFVMQLSAPARACLAGQLQGCASALRLLPPRDTLLEWFGPADRRTLAERHLEMGFVEDRDAMMACLKGDDGSCVAALRGASERRLPLPAGPSATELFLVTMLRTGSDSTLQRFLADSLTPLPQRVERAAAQPLDALLTSWRRELMAARPAPPMPRTDERLITAVSVLVLLTAVLWRRSWQ